MSGAPSTSPQPLGSIEPLDPFVSLGRGVTDVYQPAVSLYYGLTDPEKRKQYDAQRKADEALYMRGLLGTATPGPAGGPAPSDPWRTAGRYGVAAPLVLAGGGLPAAMSAGGPETLASLALTGSVYSALNALGQRLGVSPSWAANTPDYYVQKNP